MIAFKSSKNNIKHVDPQYHFRVKIPWYQNYIIKLKKSLLKFRFSFTRRLFLSPLFWANIWVIIFVILISFMMNTHIKESNFYIFLFAGPFSFAKYEFAIINIKYMTYVIIAWLIINLIIFLSAFYTAKNASPFMIDTIFAIMLIINLIIVAIIYSKFKFLGIV